MRATFLPFSRPSVSEDDIAAVTAVLRSGWITTGPRVAELEEAFRTRTGCAHAVAFSSATTAMQTLLAALGVGPGQEVLTPSMTWVSTPNLVTLAGAVPVFADVDRETLLLGPEEVERRLTPRTRLIVPVHFAGVPVDLEPLRALAARRGVPLVEDAAHAAGTAYRGREIGAVGTAIFSFHPIKNLTTGEGGMLCTDDARLAERARRLRFHGLGVDAFDRNQQGRSPQAEVQEPGWKFNLPDMLAALGVSQMKRLDAMNAARRRLAGRYLAAFATLPGVRPLGLPAWPHGHAWHLFIVRVVAEGLSREAFMEALKRRNIGTGIHFKAVHLQKHYAVQGPGRGSLPHTEWNSDRIVSLPLFPDMTDADVDDVVAAVAEATGGAL